MNVVGVRDPSEGVQTAQEMVAEGVCGVRSTMTHYETRARVDRRETFWHPQFAQEMSYPLSQLESAW